MGGCLHEDLGLYISKSAIPSPESGRQYVHIGHWRHSGAYMYLQSLSFQVLAKEYDVGKAPDLKGTWFFDPPLPTELMNMLLSYTEAFVSKACDHRFTILVTCAVMSLLADTHVFS